jgi:putative tricarboxylic transport membrane protein
MLASFLAYGVEKKLSKHPEKFGTGVIEGVAAPEGANNAATAGAMVPLLTLGIPGTPTTAVMLGALMMFGLKPGPLLMEQNPEFFWGVIASMYIGNVLLLIINLPLIPILAKAVNIPYWLLGPMIILFCIVGVFSLNNSLFDVWLLFFFSVVGYFMAKLEIPPAPAVFALILGPMMETHLKRALQISHGDLTILFLRPIAGTLWLITLVILLYPVLQAVLKRREPPGQTA